VSAKGSSVEVATTAELNVAACVHCLRRVRCMFRSFRKDWSIVDVGQ
jgi:hypothetical protein